MSWWTKIRKPLLGAVAAYFGAPYLASALGGGAAAAGGSGGLASGMGAAAGAGSEALAGSMAGGVSAGAGTALSLSTVGEAAPWLQRYGGLIGSGISGLGTYLGQSSANQANQEMARQQMQFQQYMSSTAYQRATADMAAAGLNPMLGYSQGGASTPGGSTAQMSNALGPAVSSALSAAQTMAGVDQARAQTDNIDQDTLNKQAELGGKMLSGELTRAQISQLGGSAKQAEAAAELTRSAVGEQQAKSAVAQASIRRDIEKRASESSTAGSESVIAGREARFASETGALKPVVEILGRIFGLMGRR